MRQVDTRVTTGWVPARDRAHHRLAGGADKILQRVKLGRGGVIHQTTEHLLKRIGDVLLHAPLWLPVWQNAVIKVRQGCFGKFDRVHDLAKRIQSDLPEKRSQSNCTRERQPVAQLVKAVSRGLRHETIETVSSGTTIGHAKQRQAKGRVQVAGKSTRRTQKSNNERRRQRRIEPLEPRRHSADLRAEQITRRTGHAQNSSTSSSRKSSSPRDRTLRLGTCSQEGQRRYAANKRARRKGQT